MFMWWLLCVFSLLCGGCCFVYSSHHSSVVVVAFVDLPVWRLLCLLTSLCVCWPLCIFVDLPVCLLNSFCRDCCCIYVWIVIVFAHFIPLKLLLLQHLCLCEWVITALSMYGSCCCMSMETCCNSVETVVTCLWRLLLYLCGNCLCFIVENSALCKFLLFENTVYRMKEKCWYKKPCLHSAFSLSTGKTRSQCL